MEYISEELNKELLVGTRFSRRTCTYSLRYKATSSKDNDYLKKICKRLYNLNINDIYFGEEADIRLIYDGYNDTPILSASDKEAFMKFCMTHNITITDSERNKTIRELKKTIEDSEKELDKLRKERNEERKKKREFAKEIKENRHHTGEWYDAGE